MFLLHKRIQKRRVKLGLRLCNALASLMIMIVLWEIAANGIGPLPPPGPTLNPLTGVWNSERNAQLPQSEILHFHGLARSVTVILDKNGTAHIQAQTDADLFWTMGYMQAHFRLFEMDLLRRQGEGLLSQILGSSMLNSDRFEDTLGLSITAQAQWNNLSPSSPARQGLIVYAQGVNAGIEQDEQMHTLPAMFGLLNYQPQPWTPIDSLVIKGIMTQTLSFSSTPLDYAILSNSLGYQRTMNWFPIVPLDVQHPYDTGPYTHSAAISPTGQSNINAQDMQSLASVESQLSSLPANAVKHDSMSNSWAVNGPKSASGQALLAGDPHLDLNLPSIWYQVEGRSPHYAFNGVTIPGLPIIIIGKNQQISWSITDAQNQATLFYLEQADKAHPNQYYWNGAWRQMKQVSYTIPVKGAAPVNFITKQTVHGPIVSEPSLPGKMVSVDWIGNFPSDEIDEMFTLVQATNFSQFRNALQGWVSPTLNFVYADNKGNIGIVASGAYPIVKSGSPWLPLDGTGSADIIGTIPFQDLPQVYDPPSHFVFTTNQRPVSAYYPYYIGTVREFDNGYRADEIYNQLSSRNHLTAQDMEGLQNNTQDYLATLIVPKLLAALQQQQQVSTEEKQAYTLLKSWNYDMQANEIAPTIWWTFWSQYMLETFRPWWEAQHVPSASFPSVAFNAFSLDEDLEAWTLHASPLSAFTLPSGKQRTASTTMVNAFQDTLSILTKNLGDTIQQWQWGKINLRTIPSLTGIDTLGYGPVPSNGDDWTLNVADYEHNVHGPSWRIIVDWGTGQSVGIYPGGESEDPLSPWYQNEILPWLRGQYYPMLTSENIKQDQKEATWTLQP